MAGHVSIARSSQADIKSRLEGPVFISEKSSLEQGSGQ